MSINTTENNLPPKSKQYDVIIIGAGISGIGAGCHIKKLCPKKSFAILEGRENIGGTWDLFRYPGIRSDSDMHTMGFRFRPWKTANIIAEGSSILNYLRETVEEYKLEQNILLNNWIKHASWCSSQEKWTVKIQEKNNVEINKLTCDFLWLCGGYYSYKKGYTPNFKGRESFEGQIIHPQEWPKNLNYNDKNVVVIGSGATAVTIVPSMAKKASHVTMLQRSPTYYELAPYESNLEKSLQKFFGVRLSSFVIRWMYILIGSLLFSLSRKYPDKMKKRLINHASNALGKDYAEKHFTPTYNPWDQRLCLIPDGDLFKAINSGKASVVTDHIEKFTKKGIQLKSGKHLNADLIITATGLNLEVLNGIEIKVDDTLIDFSKTMSYKGVMFSDIPNLAYTFGYTNASWTLKADLTSEYVSRLLNYMDKKDYSICCPHADDSVKEGEDWLDFSSGYIRRSIHKFPKQGSHAPWKNMQNYLKDIFVIRMSKIQDKALKFSPKKSVNSLQEPL